MAPEREYVECECSSSEHVLRLTWWEEENPWDAEVYVDVFLNEYYGFWKRLWLGIRYIFGYKSKYGQYDEAIWGRTQVKQVRALCDRWLEAHPQADPNVDPETVLKVAKKVLAQKKAAFESAQEHVWCLTNQVAPDK